MRHQIKNIDGNVIYEMSNVARYAVIEAVNEKAELEKADLRGIDLSRTKLVGAKFIRSNMQNINLMYADLQGADLYKSDLSNATLKGADIRDASLAETDLWKADLSGVRFGSTGLEEIKIDIENAKYIRDFSNINPDSIVKVWNDEKTEYTTTTYQMLDRLEEKNTHGDVEDEEDSPSPG